MLRGETLGLQEERTNNGMHKSKGEETTTSHEFCKNCSKGEAKKIKSPNTVHSV